MQQLSKQPAFELGQIVATPGALAALKKAGQQPGEFLTRHVNRELSDEDRMENDYSLSTAARITFIEWTLKLFASGLLPSCRHPPKALRLAQPGCRNDVQVVIIAMLLLLR